MNDGLSRRQYLLTALSVLPLSGSLSVVSANSSNSDTSLESAIRRRPRPDPTVTVAADRSGDYDTLRAAYGEAAAGDVIGLEPGTHSIRPETRLDAISPPVEYDTFETRALTLVGTGNAPSRLVFETSADVLVLPSWQLWNLEVDAGETVVGPRGDTFRNCTLESPLMDPVAYATGSFDGGRRTFTTAGLSPSTSAVVTYYGIAFDRVVDAVDDLGMDPTGESPIDDALNAAIQTGTLIEFPPGTYLLSQSHSIEGVDRFGMRGTGSSRRDVQLVPTKGDDVRMLSSGRSGSGAVLIENLSIDHRSDDTTIASVAIRTSGNSVMKNVEFLGRVPREDSGGTGIQLGTEVTTQDGVFLVEDVYAGVDEPAAPATYPDGVMFARAGPAHEGEVIFRNLVVHEQNSAATRDTGGSGVWTLENCEFVNNQNANVRFGAGDHPTKVSSATDCYIKVDGSRKSADAIRLDAKGGRSGVVLRGIDIEWSKDRGRGVITAPDWAEHGRAEFYDCVVRNDGANTPTINAEAVSTSDDAIVIENCSFTGSGGDFIAQNRDGSVVRNSCVDMPNASFNGFDTRNLTRSDCRVPQSPTAPSVVVTVLKGPGPTVRFSAADSMARTGSITGYEWTINGGSYEGEVVSHTFPVPGTYVVGLTLVSSTGQKTTTTTEIIVQYPELVRG